MFSKPTTLFLFLVLLCTKSFSQNQDAKQQIVQHLQDYFALERENIHLHLNKNIYLTNESIWFKGYAYNRKELLPFYSTSNVFVALYNQSGTLIKQQLVYSNMGTFDGVFKDLKQLPSGNYYIQTFTNWMNNFSENESSIYPIKIISAAQPNFFDTTKINAESAVMEINPEGGNLISGISNTVGIKIVDKFNNPIGNLKVELRDSNEKVISEIVINKDGLGKFIFTPTSSTVFTLNAKLNDKTIKKVMPSPSVLGLSLEVNNYALTNKASVKIKTNASGFAAYQATKLFLVVHQDQRALLFDVAFDEKTFEQNLVFSTENLSDGVNFVRIIDQNKNQLAERVIVKTKSNQSNFTFAKKNNSDGSVQLNGTTVQPNAHLSVSILPINAISTENSTDLNADLACNSYLIQPVKNINFYTTNPTIAKRYELDLAMLNQTKAKYEWNNIIGKAPTAQHEFDMGLTVKGKLLNNSLKKPEEHNVRLRSFLHQIMVQSPISNEGDIEFKHLLLYDSTTVDFGLYKNITPEPLKIKTSAKIVNGKRQFKYNFKGLHVADLDKMPNTTADDFPGFFNAEVQLDVVTVEVDKNALTRKDNIANRNLRGYKISENATTGVLYFIGINGFNVVDTPSQVSITNRTTTTINGAASTPVVYIDNTIIYDHSILQSMLLDEFDEIYMNPNAHVPTVRNNQGIIRLYRKTPKMTFSKSNLASAILYDGFAQPTKFKNSNYTSTSSEGFLNYGVINWNPAVLTDEKNNFQLEVPNYNQRKVKLIIEGFTYDGEMISETQIIDL